MIDRRATKTAELESAQLKRGLRAYREEILSWLKSTPGVVSGCEMVGAIDFNRLGCSVNRHYLY